MVYPIRLYWSTQYYSCSTGVCVHKRRPVRGVTRVRAKDDILEIYRSTKFTTYLVPTAVLEYYSCVQL
jgi:hypothetical protein